MTFWCTQVPTESTYSICGMSWIHYVTTNYGLRCQSANLDSHRLSISVTRSRIKVYRFNLRRSQQLRTGHSLKMLQMCDHSMGWLLIIGDSFLDSQILL